jgi:hypothetical protein
MTASRIATIVVGFVLGTTTGAFAQQGQLINEGFDPRMVERRIDPLDVVAQTERVAATVPPAFETDRPSASSREYHSYIQAYQLYLAQYSVFNQTSKPRQIEKPNKGEKTSVANVMRNISGGLALADQGLDVYGHALELQAYKNSIVQQR